MNRSEQNLNKEGIQMANKARKRHSASQVTVELHIKTVQYLKHIYWNIAPEIAGISPAGKGEATGTPVHFWWECKNGTAAFQRAALSLSHEARTLLITSRRVLPHNPAIPSIVLTQVSFETCVHAKSARKCLKQLYSECQNLGTPDILLNRWKDKLCYIQTLQYHSALKRNEPIQKTW